MRRLTVDFSRVVVEWALDYAKRGWPVFPVSRSKDKHPLTPHGFNDATTDAIQIEAWWKENPHANIGGRTGVVFDVCDFDDQDADTRAGIDLNGYPQSTTSKGKHVFFRPTGRGCRVRFLPGIDWRGEDGYVILPPSVHADGPIYKWQIEPDGEFPSCPEHLLSALVERKGPAASECCPHLFAPSGSYFDKILERLAEKPEGERNQALNDAAWSIGRWVQAANLDVDVYIEKLQEAAAANGLLDDPNDGANSVRATINSGMSAGLGEPHVVEGLPTIITNNRPMQAVTRDALEALARKNDPPMLFQRSLDLVRIVEDDKKRPVIQNLDNDRLRGHMARSAIFLRVTAEAKETKIPPPPDTVRDLAALPSWGATFPPLEAVVQTPTMRQDGTILDGEGYDAATRLYYSPPVGFEIPTISGAPTLADIYKAKKVIEDVIGEFPFSSSAAKANAYALLLTPILRPVLTGESVPLALLDAPQQGTGKSLFARLVSVLATGNESAATAGGRDEAEWRKAITSHLLAGITYVLIDNVSGPLKSDALSAVLTSPIWQDRILGASRTVTLPVHVTWVATGNNIRVGGDLIRRCYRIRLDAQVPRPWLRKKFKHPELLLYVRQHRQEVLAAALTLCRAWFAAGCPEPKSPKLGSFERWSTVLGGVLEVAKIGDFLADLNALYADADDETPEWEAFLVSLQSLFGSKEFPVGRIIDDLELFSRSALGATLPGALGDSFDSKRGVRQRFGRELKAHLGARYGNPPLHLEGGYDKHTSQYMYKVVPG